MKLVPAYYNENDPRAAAWLRELIKAGHIAPGDVDERSILDVTPFDVAGYDQCHFFAGIGGWSYALRLAGWSDARNVWTGSCPCQPFSAAGRGDGIEDDRHLWPCWYSLIRECRPAVVFGEQVASPAGLGWLDIVHADLEEARYAVGAADLCAASIGAPHIRQRLYFVADCDSDRFEERRQHDGESQQQHSGSSAALGGDVGGRGSIGVALGNTGGSRGGRDSGAVPQTQGSDWRGLWSVPDESFITGPDGKRRPIKPGLEPLVNGLPGRVGLLRGYGNAIVPQVAATFIKAYEDTRATDR